MRFLQAVRRPHLLVLMVATSGCQSEYPIEVDLSAPTPRFVLHGRTWGWPARWPLVNAFAIGAEDESLWEIEALDQERGAAARQFGIVYGDVPEGFVQTHPRNDARAKSLMPGRTYFVGATGPSGEVFRTVFALPVGPMGTPPGREQAPDRKRMDSPQTLPETSKPADAGASSAP